MGCKSIQNYLHLSHPTFQRRYLLLNATNIIERKWTRVTKCSQLNKHQLWIKYRINSNNRSKSELPPVGRPGQWKNQKRKRLKMKKLKAKLQHHKKQSINNKQDKSLISSTKKTWSTRCYLSRLWQKKFSWKSENHQMINCVYRPQKYASFAICKTFSTNIRLIRAVQQLKMT